MKIVGDWQKLIPSKQPSSKSSLAVKKMVEDDLIVAKLSFLAILSACLSNISQITKHKPVLPFLRKGLHQALLQLVVKPDVLDKCVSFADLLKINLSIADTYLKVKDQTFWIFYGKTAEDNRNFKKEASNIAVAVLEKATWKSRLHLFDPISMTILEPFEMRANTRNLSIHTVSLKIVQL